MVRAAMSLKTASPRTKQPRAYTRHGLNTLRRALVPIGNAPRQAIDGLEIVAVRRLADAIDV